MNTTTVFRSHQSDHVGQRQRRRSAIHQRVSPAPAEPVELATSLDQLQAVLDSPLFNEGRPDAMVWRPADDLSDAEVTAITSGNTRSPPEQVWRTMIATSQAVSQSGRPQRRRLADPERVVVGLPVRLTASRTASLTVAWRAKQAQPHQLAVLQLAARGLEQEYLQPCQRELESAADDLAAILDRTSCLLDPDPSGEVLYQFCNQLRPLFCCRQVAWGAPRRRGGRCRLMALSDTPRFDARSPAVRGLENAMDEAALVDQPICWPAEPAPEALAGDQPLSLAHRSAGMALPAQRLISMPLRDGSNRVAAVVTLIDPEPQADQRNRQLLEAARGPWARAYSARVQMRCSGLTRWLRRTGHATRRWQAVAVVMLLLGLSGLCLLPIKHQIKADCQIEPRTRRFVAAPFDGILAGPQVKPGDLVHRGQTLATMDPKELHWEREDLLAELSRATKQRDAAQVAHQYGAAQIARLEMQRLQLKIEQLDHRREQLVIKSPIDGVVTTGDLQRAKGAPVEKGQTLFEIAPLDVVVVEVAVAQEDVVHVRPGERLDLRLDAFPDQVWQTRAGHLQPRSVIRDDQNVFVLEATLANRAEQLRPGMKGRAAVSAGRRPLGWVWFHKPWIRLRRWWTG